MNKTILLSALVSAAVSAGVVLLMRAEPSTIVGDATSTVRENDASHVNEPLSGTDDNDSEEPTLHGHSDARSSRDEQPMETAASMDELASQVAAVLEENKSLRETVKRLERAVEGPDLSTVATDKLLTQAYKMRHAKEHDKALRMFKELLSRDDATALSDENRTKVMEYLGYTYRELGDHDQEEKTFIALEERHGEGTAGYGHARFQRAWANYYRGDKTVGRDMMREVAQMNEVNGATRTWSRIWDAYFTQQEGDKDYARAEFTRLRDEFADNETSWGKSVLQTVERYLKGLDKGG